VPTVLDSFSGDAVVDGSTVNSGLCDIAGKLIIVSLRWRNRHWQAWTKPLLTIPYTFGRLAKRGPESSSCLFSISRI